MLFPISLCPQPRLGLLQLSTCPPRPFATPGTVCTISEITLPVQQAFCSSLPAHKAFCYSQDPLYCFQIHFPPPRQITALRPPTRPFATPGTFYAVSEIILPTKWAFHSSLPTQKTPCNSQDHLYCFSNSFSISPNLAVDWGHGACAIPEFPLPLPRVPFTCSTFSVALRVVGCSPAC